MSLHLRNSGAFGQPVMDGYVFLCRAVKARFEALDRFVSPMATRSSSEEPFLTSQLLAKEALTSIVVGVARGLKQVPVLTVGDFCTFDGAKSTSIHINLSDKAQAMLRSAPDGLYHPLEINDLFSGREYWQRAFKEGAGAPAIRGIIVDALDAERRNAGTAFLPAHQDRFAVIAVQAFFTALLNGVVLSRAVSVGGLGKLQLTDGPRIQFEPDRSLVETVEVRERRQRGAKVDPTLSFVHGERYDAPADFEALERHIEDDLIESDIPEDRKKRGAGPLAKFLRAFHKTT